VALNLLLGLAKSANRNLSPGSKKLGDFFYLVTSF